MTHSTIDTQKMDEAINRYGPTAARATPEILVGFQP